MLNGEKSALGEMPSNSNSSSKLNAKSPNFIPSSSNIPRSSAKTKEHSADRKPHRNSEKKTQGMPRKNQQLASSERKTKNKKRLEKQSSAIADSIGESLDDPQTVYDEHLFDILSARTNKRGQINLNHLLNFQFTPRTNSNAFSAPPRRSRGYNTYGQGSGHHPMDKSRYVNANYRFVVSPIGDYQSQKLDPDSPVKWEDVWQVLCSSDFQLAACPFCLEEKPIAARMSRCGHVYCFSCLLRFVETPTAAEVKAAETSGTKIVKCGHRSCPICWDSIRLRDVRPIRWVEDKEFQKLEEGKSVCLRLYQRNNGSILAFPRSCRSFALDGSFHSDEIPNFTMSGAAYARIIIGSHDYMVQQHLLEIEQLQQIAAEDISLYGSADTYYERITQILLDRISSLSESVNEQTIKSLQTDIDNLCLQSNSLKQLSEVDDLNDVSGSEIADAYLFYQPFAHSHVYLSPLDIRILKSAFGSYENFPDELVPRVERISSGHLVNSELRQRFKYMAHLPEGCEVAFIECDWSKIIPKEVLLTFKSEISKRRKQRKAQEMREERYRQRAERATEEQIYSELNMQRPVPKTVVHEDPAEAFPTLGSHHQFESTDEVNTDESTLSTAKTVWGTRALANIQNDTDDQDDLDGWKVDWDKVAQLSAPSKNSKNKKKKKLVLLSTGAAHR
ncbi:Ubiquitin-protein ligase E3 [Schizosaccharomyces pombe]